MARVSGMAAGAVMLAGAVAVAAGGCGDNREAVAPAGDAAVLVDSGVPDAAPLCTPDFGRAYFLESIAIMGNGEGYDRDGDGVPDNALWPLGLQANPGFEESIVNGNSIFLIDFTGWPAARPIAPVAVGLAFYQALDADQPPDPTNNNTGHAHFLLLPEAFDTDCQPLYPWDQATLDGTEATMATRRWRFGNIGSGTVEFVDAIAWAHFDDDYERASCEVSAVWTLCGLSTAQMPGTIPGTMLDFMANTLTIQPDVDRDGDGVEQVVGDGTSILSCRDGDGTEIPGRDCPCDPRMVDGYSVTIAASVVSAAVVGLAARQQ